KGEEVSEVLVVGRGAGEVRERLYDIAFLAALAAPFFPREATEHELQQLERRADEAARAGRHQEAEQVRAFVTAWRDTQPAEVLDGLIWLSRRAVFPQVRVPLPALAGGQDLDSPFTVLVQELRALAQSSALVQLHEAEPAALEWLKKDVTTGLLFDDK